MEFLTALLASEKFTIFATAMLTLAANVVVQLVAVHSSAKAETKRTQRAKHLDEQRAALKAALTLADALGDHYIANPFTPAPMALRTIFRTHYTSAVRTSMYLVNDEIRTHIEMLHDLLHTDHELLQSHIDLMNVGLDIHETFDVNKWLHEVQATLVETVNTIRELAQKELNAMGK